MKVSFFQNGSHILGIDYSYTPWVAGVPPELDADGNIITAWVEWVPESGHPECIFCADIEFDESKQKPVLTEKKGKYSVSVEDIPETLDQIKSRKFEEFITSENISDFDWEWVALDRDDYNNLIVLRDFGGDRGAQMATSFKKDIKDLYVMIVVLKVPLTVIQQIYADDIAITEKVIESRKALGLSAPDISFLYE